MYLHPPCIYHSRRPPSYDMLCLHSVPHHCNGEAVWTMVAWLKLDSSRSPQGRLTTAGIGKRSTAACAAVALLPGAMSFLRAAGLCVGGGSSNFSGGVGGVLRTTTSRFYAQAVSGADGGSGQDQARHAAAAAFRWRGGGQRGLAMVGGAGGEGSGYDFAKRATRFESSFAEGDSAAAKGAVPVTVLPDKASFERWLGSQPPSAKSWIKTLGQDSHTAGRMVLVPSSVGDGGGQEGGEGEVSLSEVAFCLGEGDNSAGSPFSLCSLREKLPAGTYALRGADGDVAEPDTAALSWAIGGYSFDRFKSKKSDGGEKEKESKVVLAWPAGADKGRVSAAAASTFLVRDLITTPCEHMGPQHLEAVFASLAEEFGGTTKVVRGEELLKEGDSYPMVHAVGRAAGVGREPRLLDLTWAPPGSDAESLPKVTLVGKGVCFDTGGLDIKPAAGMLTMKKDMGGGAQVLGLARMIMSQGLPVRLRVMVPAVENAIDGGAFRPGDVLVSRSGKTSEIGNTDAEGRLVLADALVEASSEMPDLLIDCATLTGAARVALGTEVPVVFCNDEEVAAKLHTLSGSVSDQVWRLPLWEGYRSQLSSKIADLKNVGAGGYGGAITAALYLDEFVGEKAPSREEEGGGKKEKLPWIHMDFMAFNTNSRPGRPEGGESQGMRALYALLEDKYGSA